MTRSGIRRKSTRTFQEQWESARERFWAKVRVTETCWLWTDTLVDDYAHFFMGGQLHRAHRIAYRWAYGSIPEGIQVDHRCRVKHCVNPAHLRLATNKQNMENVGLSSRNTSGVRGVAWAKVSGKWRAQIGHNGQVIYLGLFADIKEAEAVVLAKRLELFTHNIDDRQPATL